VPFLLVFFNGFAYTALLSAVPDGARPGLSLEPPPEAASPAM